jgi:hypothetical protein
MGKSQSESVADKIIALLADGRISQSEWRHWIPDYITSNNKMIVANAKNLAQSHTEGGTDKGTSPGKVNNGITKTAGEKFDAGKNGNVPGGKMGVKNLSKVAGGHGAEKKGAGPGPVGSGTGDKAGQTSIAKIPTFLKKL